jgi:type II secretory pathway component PulF
MRPWLLAPGPEDALTSLADALDAGLPAESALAVAGVEHAAPPGTPIHEALAAAWADLSPTERMVLRAAEQGGALATALRRLAEDRRTQRVRRRALTGRLAYPILVVLVAALVSLLFAVIGMPGLGLGFWGSAALALAACTGLVSYARRRLRTDPGFELPFVAAPIARAAATPYFEAVHALYAAGVRIDQAHGEAVSTCPHAALRARLVAAQTSLAAGVPYAEALATAGAFDDWVRTVLRDAERSGNLENGLRHVITRLRAATDAAAQNAIRVLGGLAYACAVLVVLVTVARFYGGLAERLGGIGR